MRRIPTDPTTAMDERRAVLRDLEAVEARFRAERGRHREATAKIRTDLHTVVKRGEAAGVSITSMAKAMKISRGRLKRLLDTLG